MERSRSAARGAAFRGLQRSAHFPARAVRLRVLTAAEPMLPDPVQPRVAAPEFAFACRLEPLRVAAVARLEPPPERAVRLEPLQAAVPEFASAYHPERLLEGALAPLQAAAGPDVLQAARPAERLPAAGRMEPAALLAVQLPVQADGLEPLQAVLQVPQPVVVEPGEPRVAELERRAEALELHAALQGRSARELPAVQAALLDAVQALLVQQVALPVLPVVVQVFRLPVLQDGLPVELPRAHGLAAGHGVHRLHHHRADHPRHPADAADDLHHHQAVRGAALHQALHLAQVEQAMSGSEQHMA
jgi:hypothetical protein